MAFRDQLRRPVVAILLVLVPAFIVLLAVAQTKPTPRRIELPGGALATTTMKALHGPEMAKISVAFAAALVAVFVTQSALQGDRRLVLAGLHVREALLARVAVVAAATGLVVAVAAASMALDFTPASWLPVLAGLVLTGLIYAALGVLAGVLLDALPATYLILFLAMTDLGVVQTPMFHASPAPFAWLLPGYAPSRVMIAGAYEHGFDATGDLMLALGWCVALAAVVYLILRRALGERSPDADPTSQDRQILFAGSSRPDSTLWP
jgi:hypothetical protein